MELDDRENSTKKTARRFLGKDLATRVGFIAIGVAIGVILGIGGTLFLQNHNPKDEKSQVDILAASVVFERIVAQNEMICASQQYNITEKAGSTNKIPFTDIEIPFTSNSFWYRYVGTIKVGVDLSTASFEQKSNVLIIELDPPYISSNTPDLDKSGVLEETNNILNPIHVEDVDAFRAQCVEMSQTQAYEGTLFEEAKANAEQNLADIFHGALGEEYEVQVAWRE